MQHHIYSGKNYNAAVQKAIIELQEISENLIINEINSKDGLFSKKVEIDVVEKAEVKRYIKSFLYNFLKDLGFNANIEMTTKDDIPVFNIFSDNDSLLIGKNGKNLSALSYYVKQVLYKEIMIPYKFIIDVSDYNKAKEKSLEKLAINIAKEVKKSKVEASLDSMNSYERRIVHNILKDNKYVYTESIGEDPNRKVVIKPREE